MRDCFLYVLTPPTVHELWYRASPVDRLGYPEAILLIAGVRAVPPAYHKYLVVPQVYCLVVRVG